MLSCVGVLRWWGNGCQLGDKLKAKLTCVGPPWATRTASVLLCIDSSSGDLMVVVENAAYQSVWNSFIHFKNIPSKMLKYPRVKAKMLIHQSSKYNNSSVLPLYLVWRYRHGQAASASVPEIEFHYSGSNLLSIAVVSAHKIQACRCKLHMRRDRMKSLT